MNVCVYTYIYIWFLKKNHWTKSPWNYGLTFLLTFLAERLTFLLTFSYIHSICLLPGAPAAPAAGPYWFITCFSAMLVAAAGFSWLLTAADAAPPPYHFLLTFALRFAYVFATLKRHGWNLAKTNDSPIATWYKETWRCSSPSLLPLWTWPYTPCQYKNNVKAAYSTCAIPGLRFCLRFWRPILRFCLRFAIKCL